MATVVITLLIITRFSVSKMDADSEERRRDRISRREKRWSMNSQRLEQIVAELMRPIGDLRRSFDTDLSALLEQYLTEAGLHALEADASGGGPGVLGAPGAPNFTELALLLQQSANIYGRKVDFLYQHVLAVSESLQNSSHELSQPGASPEPAEATPGGSRRKRRASAPGWARIALEPAPAAAREPALRPPPTLPRLFAELEPRVLAAGDAPLLDYAAEPVGLLQDFHVAWRLHNGFLVDELECGEAETTPLRAIPLDKLRAALEAAAAGRACSTPLPPEEPPPEAPAGSPSPPEGAESPDGAAPASEEPAPTPRRKRKLDEDLFEGRLSVTPELSSWLEESREFSVPSEWIESVVDARRRRLLACRAKLQPPPEEFRGFDDLFKTPAWTCRQSLEMDIGGFLGFESSSVAEREVMLTLTRLAEAVDSDDDGFFELSSLGSEGSARLEPPSPPPAPPPTLDLDGASSSSSWAAWRARVLARAARAPDVAAAAGAVLRALPDAGAAPFARVLRAAEADEDVSRLFLATLFLANAGNVEVLPGAPLSVGGFALRLRSRDPRLYGAAAAPFLAR